MEDFGKLMGGYKAAVDADIASFCATFEERALERYGEPGAITTQAFSEILSRDGKRIRGALTMVGYEMCGGTDQKMIIQAARVIEMMHAYMLIIDDIQDRSDMRRGGPSAHKILERTHKEMKWRSGEAEHTGLSLAINASIIGSHSAQIILSNLDVDPELRLKAVTILNNTMTVTAQGQTHDIVNEVRGFASVEDIENVLQWKTAHYTFLNPIHTGMVLAGAGCEDTNGITQYALELGKAFQIMDDLIIMSDKADKNQIDDIREGKQTLLTAYALENGTSSQIETLRSCLGSHNLKPSDLRSCQQIFVKSGAVDFAKTTARQHVADARASLTEHADQWDANSVKFLDDLAQYILNRIS